MSIAIGPGEESLGVDNGKLGMWTFLVMDAMTFAGFLAGYARLRWKAPLDGMGQASELVNTVGSTVWPNPYTTFGVIGIQLTAFNTFILICSSVTMVHVLSDVAAGRIKRAEKWCLATMIGGLFFLGIQGYEWTHLMQVWGFFSENAAALPYNQNFVATFLSLTGFHGAHVAVGVMFNTILYLGLRNGKVGKEQYTFVEIAGLYWHFVDLVWILVFTFVYLL